MWTARNCDGSCLPSAQARSSLMVADSCECGWFAWCRIFVRSAANRCARVKLPSSLLPCSELWESMSDRVLFHADRHAAGGLVQCNDDGVRRRVLYSSRRLAMVECSCDCALFPSSRQILLQAGYSDDLTPQFYLCWSQISKRLGEHSCAIVESHPNADPLLVVEMAHNGDAHAIPSSVFRRN